MSQELNTTISAATGTFRLLTDNNVGESRIASGKPPSDTGRSLPPPAADTKPEIERIVQKLNTASISIGRELRFQVNLHSGKSVIQVLDSETGEIIRQIPEEEASSYLQSAGNLAIRMFDELV